MMDKTIYQLHQKYRPEVDGLRSLAVIPVILFHAGFTLFSGGFVGVDVFFVISGYLITTIILSELEAGNFSLVKFYERRARRILPALFLVMVVCLPFAWMWLFRKDLKDFTQSMAAVSVFSSNFLFLSESGYFDTAAELKPLLHTWSLAVEEQFYVLFPLFLMFSWRWGKKWMLPLLSLATIASLALAHWGAFNAPSANFYLLPSRGWELAIGAFVAFHFFRKQSPSFPPALNQLLSGTGLLSIVFSVFFFDSNTPFPSLYALIPTLGTALILLCAWPTTFVGKLLGRPLFVGMGLISYSAYLWHQPLFAFARHRYLNEPGPLVFGLLALTSIGLAYLSWRFVERPFRKQGVFSRKQVFLLAGGGTIFFIAILLLVPYLDRHFPEKIFRESVGELQHRVRANFGLRQDCVGQSSPARGCMTSEDPEIMLWGDSYAMHLMQGILASKPDAGIVQMTVSLCGPILDAAPVTHGHTEAQAKRCLENNDRVIAYIAGKKTIKYVVLGSAFIQYLEKNARLLLRDGSLVSGEQETLSYMRKTLKKLKDLGVTPVLFSPTPQNGNDLGRCLIKAIMFGENMDSCDLRMADAERRQKDVFQMLTRIEAEGNRVVWLTRGMCHEGTCNSSIGNKFLYRDAGHLSYEGSAALGRKMDFYALITRANGSSSRQ